MAIIVLSQVGFEGRHGATAAERRTTRKFEVDLHIDVEPLPAERSDRLADTIDYREVAEIVVTIGSGEPHRLLESLGRRMLDALAARFTGARFTLDLRKFSPPGCAGHPAYAAVRLLHPQGK